MDRRDRGQQLPVAGAGRATAGRRQSLLWRDPGLVVPADAGRDWRSCWARSGEGYEKDGLAFDVELIVVTVTIILTRCVLK